MDHQQAFVRQVFGNTSLGSGATAFQGSFPNCTFNTIAGLPPELFPHLQEFLRHMIPGNSDAQYDRLCTSVTQLGFLGKAQRQLATGEEAKRILGNISSVLKAISQPASLVESDEARDMLRKESLQAIDGILTTSQEVHINKTEAIRRGPFETSESIQISRNEHLSRVPLCEVQIQTWKVEAGEQGHNRKYEELYTRIDIRPEVEGDPERRPFLSVYIKRFWDLRHALAQPVVLGPLIIARRTIPEWSAIHRTIQDGDFKAFQRLLKDGEASLWDCDEYGRSLITYAVHECQPDICSYLIHKGADVDSVEPAFENPISSHLLAHVSIGEYICDRPHNRANECRALLLRAGADPTIGGKDSALCTFLADDPIVPDDHVTTIRNLLLEHGSHYINPKERDESGRTLLHHVCSYESYFEPLEGVDILLGLGFDANARDKEGNTGLHLAIKAFSEDCESPQDLDHVLISLIKAGADPHAANNRGDTPGSLADEAGVLELLKVWLRVKKYCDLPFDIFDELRFHLVGGWDSYSVTSDEGTEENEGTEEDGGAQSQQGSATATHPSPASTPSRLP